MDTTLYAGIATALVWVVVILMVVIGRKSRRHSVETPEQAKALLRDIAEKTRNL